jgi:hypothetical protein
MGWKIEGGGGGRYGGWIVYVGRRWLEACRDEMRKQDLCVGPVPTVYEKIFRRTRAHTCPCSYARARTLVARESRQNILGGVDPADFCARERA